MGLPWIELDNTLPRHRKSIRLSLLLGDRRAWTYLPELWLYCSEQNVSGMFTGEDAADLIEHAAGWTGDRGAFVAAATKAGFLDVIEGGWEAHGWKERAAAHLAKQERDKERAKKNRERIAAKFAQRKPNVQPQPEQPSQGVACASPERSADVHRNNNPNPNPKPNPSLSEKKIAPAEAAAPPPEKPKPKRKPPDPRFGPLRAATEAAYERLRGSKYVWAWERDSPALSALIADFGDAEILRRWEHGLSLGTTFPGVSNVGQLRSRFNDFTATAGSRRPPRQELRPEDHSAEGREVSVDDFAGPWAAQRTLSSEFQAVRT
jgi:hypothetical protein